MNIIPDDATSCSKASDFPKDIKKSPEITKFHWRTTEKNGGDLATYLLLSVLGKGRKGTQRITKLNKAALV